MHKLFGSDLTILKNRLKTDVQLQHAWQAFRQRTEAMGVAKVEEWLARLEHEGNRARTLGAKRWLRYGNSLRHLSALLTDQALVRQASGDSTNFGQELMLADRIFTEPEWRAQGRTQTPVEWQSDLWTGDMAQAMALWLSWSQEPLEATTTARYTEALTRLGIAPIVREWVNAGTRIHALDSMGHNWWSVIVGGAGLAALVVEDRAHTQACRDNLLSWMDFRGNVLQNKTRTFGRGGGFVETPTYCEYALYNLLLFAFALREATGDAALLTHPALQGLPDWFLAHCYSDSALGWRYVNFGDCGAVSGRPAVWLALGRALGDHRMLAGFHRWSKRMTSAGDFLWYEPAEGPGPKPPTTAIFRDSGVAFLRSCDGQHLLAVRAGEVWNHNHCDTGHYVFFSGGRNWVLDPGTCSYGRAEYARYMVTPSAHNVILCNGAGVPEAIRYAGTPARGDFPVVWQHGDYRYLLVDATGPYAGLYERFYRHVIWLEDVGVVIVDDVASPSAATFTYVLHPNGDLVGSISEGNYKIMQGTHSSRALALGSSLPLRRKEANGYAVQPGVPVVEDAPLPEMAYYLFQTTTTDRRAKFVTLLGFSDRPTAVISRVHATLLCCDVTAGDRRYTIWINELADGRAMHRNSWQAWDDIQTDAFLVVKSAQSPGAYIHNGSYLRRGGRSLFEALAKADAAVTAPW